MPKTNLTTFIFFFLLTMIGKENNQNFTTTTGALLEPVQKSYDYVRDNYAKIHEEEYGQIDSFDFFFDFTIFQAGRDNFYASDEYYFGVSMDDDVLDRIFIRDRRKTGTGVAMKVFRKEMPKDYYVIFPYFGPGGMERNQLIINYNHESQLICFEFEKSILESNYTDNKITKIY